MIKTFPQNPIVIDNYLPHEVISDLRKYIIGNANFPWYYHPFVSTPDADDGEYYSHVVYNMHRPIGAYEMCIPMLNYLNPFGLHRIKVNRYPRTDIVNKHGWHRDYEIPFVGAIIYLNTCDGKTIFESGEEIDSIENRLLLFDSSQNHRSTTCTDDRLGRYNINMNFYTCPLLNT